MKVFKGDIFFYGLTCQNVTKLGYERGDLEANSNEAVYALRVTLRYFYCDAI